MHTHENSDGRSVARWVALGAACVVAATTAGAAVTPSRNPEALVAEMRATMPEKFTEHLPGATRARAAQEALVKAGSRAVSALIAALEDPNDAFRAHVVATLGRIGDARARPHVLALAGDPAPGVRANAVLALGRIGGEEALAPLLAATRDDHPLVPGHALWGLRILKDPRSGGHLLKLLSDPRYNMKSAVRDALIALRDPKMVPALIEMLKNPNVAGFAACVLGEIGDLAAIHPLRRQLDSPVIHNQIEAMRALIRLDGLKAVRPVSRIFCQKTDLFPNSFVYQLWKMGPEAIPALAAALALGSHGVKYSARNALKRVYGKSFADGGEEWLVYCHLNGMSMDREAEPWPLLSRAEATYVLVRDREYGLPEQTGTTRFLLTRDGVVASLWCNVEDDASGPGRGPRRVRFPRVENAVVCWDYHGRLRWRVGVPAPTHMVETGDSIVLCHEGRGLHRKRGLVWLDRRTGVERRRVAAPGRPLRLTYHAPTGMLLVAYRRAGVRTSAGEESVAVFAYRGDGTVAWTRADPVADLEFLGSGPAAVVAGSRFEKQAFIAGFDPSTGAQLWRRSWSPFPVPPRTDDLSPETGAVLVPVEKREGFEFVHPATGLPLHAVGRPAGPFEAHIVAGHRDCAYVTSRETHGPTLGAFDPGSGLMLWADTTETVCSGSPFAWGENVGFLCRRNAAGDSRQADLTEVRIYGVNGSLLCHDVEKRSREHWDDRAAPQVRDGRLYAVKAGKLCSYVLEMKPHADAPSAK